jgi:hypothetical protein
MKILLPCFQCLDEREGKPLVVIGQLQDDMSVPTSCPKGHKFVALVQNARFEVLFESASLALLDGYPREAVASFTAALERFYEFYVRVALRREGITQSQVAATWKLVAKQSERQLGAFAFTYLRQTRGAFVLPQEIPAFRNRVLHEGYIPTDAEVRDYAQRILTLIEEVVQTIRDQGFEPVGAEVFEDLQERNSHLPVGVRRLTHAGLMVLDVTCKRDINTKTLDERLAELKDYRLSLMEGVADYDV